MKTYKTRCPKVFVSVPSFTKGVSTTLNYIRLFDNLNNLKHCDYDNEDWLSLSAPYYDTESGKEND